MAPIVLCVGGVPKQSKIAIEAEIENNFVYYLNSKCCRVPLAGSAAIVGQCTRSGKYVSDSVSVSGMVSSSKAFIYMASPISISSTVSAVHGEARQEFARFSNSYKDIVFF